MRFSHFHSTVLAFCLFSIGLPSHAVIILDSTYKQYGFKAAEARALEPQFKSLIYLSDSGSGAWIGNVNGHGYVLTAAHMFDEETKAGDFGYTTLDGQEYTGDKVYFHPLWNGSTETRTGFDFAIVRLTKEVHDAGPQPYLYGGTKEKGHILVFIGYGYRGKGTKGQDTNIDTHNTPAAGEGLIEKVVDAIEPAPKNDDAGNYFGIWLPKENGAAENPLKEKGITKPISPLAGILGSGDSGGPVWITTEEGWAIAGVNSNGSGNAGYGDESWFARVSHVRDWIEKIVPSAKFVDD
jgi:hypothetical protein